jgi:hypothetical protein
VERKRILVVSHLKTKQKHSNHVIATTRATASQQRTQLPTTTGKRMYDDDNLY